jgi:WD40 repeat protein
VCQAVQHAHQKGVIHRDLKPSNVLVTLYDDKPVPKVIDFGVAKAIEQKLTEQTLFTKVGQVIGTLEYMSPEQASLNALDVDTRSDVYALGVLLYELLTGSTPLDKQQLEGVAFMEMLRLIREVEPPRPSTRLSEMKGGLSLMAAYRKTDAQKLPKLVAGELDWIAMKALEKDRSRRYETASALAADVRRYLSEQPVEARPPSAWYRFRKLARRNRAAVTAATLVAAALVVGTVVAWLFALEAGRNAEWAYKEKENADKQAERALANEETANKRAEEIKTINEQLLALQENQQHSLNAATMKLVQFAWQSDDVSRSLNLLNKLIPATGQKDLRHFEWHYWDRLIHGAKEVVPLKSGGPQSYAEFSPSQSLLASVVLNGDRVIVRLWDTKTGAVVRDLKGPVLGQPPPGRTRAPKPVIGNLVFSEDGKSLAAIIRMPTVSADPAFDGTVKGLKDLGPKSSAPELWLWEIKSGSDLWHKPLPGASLVLDRSSFCFHPTGESIAVPVNASKGETVIHELAQKDGKLLQTFGVPENAKKDGFATRLLCLSPDRKKLLLNQYPMVSTPKEEQPPALLLWDVEADEEVWRVSSPVDSGIDSFAMVMGMGWKIAGFSPDGKRLFVQEIWIITGATAKSGIWVCDAANGKTLGQCKVDSLAPTDFVRQCQFSADGKSLIGKPRGPEAPGTPVLVWDTATGKLRQKVLIPADKVWDAAFSAGGEWLYIAAGKTVQIWPASKPGPFLVNAGPDLTFYWPSLSGDGRRLAVVSWPGANKIDDETHKRSTLQVVDTTNGKQLLNIKTLRAPVLRYMLSADGKRLVACLGALTGPTAEKLKGEIVVWDVDERKEIVSCPLPTTLDVGDKARQVFPVRAAFSVDGRLAALSWQRTENEHVVKVWKLPDGKDVPNCKEIFDGTFAGARLGLLGAQFSQDGRLLFFATGGPKEAKALWGTPVPHIIDLRTAKELPSILPELPISNMYFQHTGPTMTDIPLSPDGNLLAWYDGPTIFSSTEIKSCDIVVANLHPKGKKNLRLMGHTGPVTSMAFSPDGQRLASLASRSSGPFSSREIKIWDLHTGQDVLTLTGEGMAGTLQFSADGRSLFVVRQFYASTAAAGKSLPSRCEVHTWDATPLPDAGP